MRVSILRDDPAYMRYTEHVTIYFDRKKVSGVITADEEQGYIVRYARNDEGDYILNRGELVTEKYLGDVRIVLGQPIRDREDGLYAK